MTTLGTFVFDLDEAELLDRIVGIFNGNGVAITAEKLAEQLGWLMFITASDTSTRKSLTDWAQDIIHLQEGEVSGVGGVATYALLAASPAPGPGESNLRRVTNDPDPLKDGTYRYDAAAPAPHWVKSADPFDTIPATVDLLRNVVRRVAIPAGDIIIDRLGLLGGGTSQLYIPRGTFIDMPGVVGSTVTATNANSTELPGWSKLTIPTGLRSFAYLDLTDNTLKIIGATAGDFALPTIQIDKSVPIICFPFADSGWWSPYKVRELNPAHVVSAFAPLGPIVHNRAENEVLIPSANARNEIVLNSHTVADGQRYEAFGLTSSNASIKTYWYDYKANLYRENTAGVAPYTVDPRVGVVIGWSWGGEFFSPWPHVGRMGQGLGKNDFAYGKGDRMLLSPSVWEGEIANLGMVDVADAALIALGFTRALRTTNAAATWPYIGDRIPDNRAGKSFFARVWLEATVDNDFGAARTVRFIKADGFGLSVQFILEKTLSARAAIYSVVAPMPDWTLNSPASGEYIYVHVGVSTPGGTNEVRIAGAQFAFGQNAQWIERNDFPTTAANGIRITNLESAAAETDPVPAILYGEDLWLITGRQQLLHLDNVFEQRTERKGVLTTLFAPNPLVATTTAKPYELTLESGSFVVDPAEIGDVASLWTHRYSDTAGAAALGRSYRSAPITVHKASSSGAGTVRVMGIGDSIMSQTLSTYVRDILAARGMTVAMSGTVGPTGNEGRPGSTFTDHIHARTDWLTTVTNWAAYLAASDAEKQTFDVMTREATGGDPAGSIYNGRIYDFAYYLTNTGITPPTHVWICLGTNDIAAYAAATAADWVNKALVIMVGSILATVPTAKIAIGLPTLPRTATADARWNASYGLAIRAMLKFKRTLANAQVKVIPIWAHINQVTGFANSEVVVSTDVDTGMVTLDNGDLLHPSPAGVHQYAEVVAAWVANTFDGT
ncbi:SGNH/GDSL hydrolase family protein [Inquilinus sp. CA228]|uniref:SGNH/GDSL hydrolase family protein n=1 Tax=Inquilinus sp. CA228 TaxID=3455609 RepID=UPI003F8D1648